MENVLADSSLTVALRKRGATAMSMGTAERWVEVHVVFIYPYSVR